MANKELIAALYTHSALMGAPEVAPRVKVLLTDAALIMRHAAQALEGLPSETPAIPPVLYDGMGVYVEANSVRSKDIETLKPHHVSAVLDAVVRLLRRSGNEEQR